MKISKRALIKHWQHELWFAWRQRRNNRFCYYGFVFNSDSEYVRICLNELRKIKKEDFSSLITHPLVKGLNTQPV
jgi:hypothetical protein